MSSTIIKQKYFCLMIEMMYNLDMPPLSQNSRQRILTYLQKNQSATVKELSIALGKTRANIQYHIQTLIQDGQIMVVTIHRQSEQRGRPVISYGLASSLKPDNYKNLCNALMNQSLEKLDKNNNDCLHLIMNLANYLIPSLSQKSKHITLKLNTTIMQLNQHAYQARWEARFNGPFVIFKNCPYSSLLTEHPEFCLMDKCLLEQHLGVSVVQQSIQGKGQSECVFKILLS